MNPCPVHLSKHKRATADWASRMAVVFFLFFSSACLVAVTQTNNAHLHTTLIFISFLSPLSSLIMSRFGCWRGERLYITGCKGRDHCRGMARRGNPIQHPRADGKMSHLLYGRKQVTARSDRNISSSISSSSSRTEGFGHVLSVCCRIYHRSLIHTYIHTYLLLWMLVCQLQPRD